MSLQAVPDPIPEFDVESMDETELRGRLDHATQAALNVGDRLADAVVDEHPLLALMLAASYRETVRVRSMLKRALVARVEG